MLFKFIYSVEGGHTHVRVFAGKGTGNLGKCGDLVFRNEEWVFFKAGLDQTIGTEKGLGHYVDYVEQER